jgi:ABC-type multidrug transport system ATPase subunit
VVYTSHYMEEVEQLCTRIVIMDKGKTLATGTKEELKAMINDGETISVEMYVLQPDDLDSDSPVASRDPGALCRQPSLSPLRWRRAQPVALARLSEVAGSLFQQGLFGAANVE